MEEKTQVSDEQSQPVDQSHVKPYEKPQILYRAPLEAMAAVCQPGPPPAGPGKSGGNCTNLQS